MYAVEGHSCGINQAITQSTINSDKMLCVLSRVNFLFPGSCAWRGIRGAWAGDVGCQYQAQPVQYICLYQVILTSTQGAYNMFWYVPYIMANLCDGGGYIKCYPLRHYLVLAPRMFGMCVATKTRKDTNIPVRISRESWSPVFPLRGRSDRNCPFHLLCDH